MLTLYALVLLSAVYTLVRTVGEARVKRRAVPDEGGDVDALTDSNQAEPHVRCIAAVVW